MQSTLKYSKIPVNNSEGSNETFFETAFLSVTLFEAN